MKTYTKPRMLLLSLSANDMLCVGCTAQTRFDKTLNNALIAMFGDKDKDGIFEPGDSNAFSYVEACAEPYQFESYCKFTAADNGMIQLFTS